jgi:hypothetical protein
MTDEAYDRAESHAEARAIAGEPDASDDGYWFALARDITAPIPVDALPEVSFA